MKLVKAKGGHKAADLVDMRLIRAELDKTNVV